MTRALTTLNMFISKYSDKCSLFSKVIRDSRQWILECEEALSKIKTYLQQTPILTSPKERESIGVYLAVFKIDVS